MAGDRCRISARCSQIIKGGGLVFLEIYCKVVMEASDGKQDMVIYFSKF